MKFQLKTPVRAIFAITLFLALAGCSKPSSGGKGASSSNVSVVPGANTGVKFEHVKSELVDVTVGPGYKFYGAFDEISSTQTLSDGYTIRGTWY